MSKRKSPAQLYAERYSHTGYTVATTHAPQFGPNVIVQDNTWELTREIKILPQPFVNPGGAASIRSIKFLIPPVVAETWIPSECSLSLSYDVNKADGTALTRPAAAANAENVHARYAGWPNAMLIDDINVTINGSTTLQNLDRDRPLRKYMTFITNATDLTRKRPAATQIFDWDEEYDSIIDATDKVRVGTATAGAEQVQTNLKERQMQLSLQQHPANMFIKPLPGDFFSINQLIPYNTGLEAEISFKDPSFTFICRAEHATGLGAADAVKFTVNREGTYLKMKLLTPNVNIRETLEFILQNASPNAPYPFAIPKMKMVTVPEMFTNTQGRIRLSDVFTRHSPACLVFFVLIPDNVLRGSYISDPTHFRRYNLTRFQVYDGGKQFFEEGALNVNDATEFWQYFWSMSGAEEDERQAWYWRREQVLDGGKFFIPVDFSTAKDGGKTTGPFMEHPVDVELTFGAREARLGGDINSMRLLAFYNTVENLWLSDPINKNYYQPREQTDYPGAAGRSITPGGEPLSKIMRT